MNAAADDIRLRAMEPEDLDMLYRIENDTELWDVGLTNVPYSRYMLHDYIANARNDIYADRQVRLIIETHDGQLVGLLDLMNFDPKHLRAELGLVVERSWRRQGIAASAVRQCIGYARRTLHLHQLYALVAVGNTPAMALFSKAGFTSSGHLDQWLYDGEAYHDAVVMQCLL